MSWNERLSDAIYTSPSRRSIIFTYENVSKEINKKTTAFDYPDANGTYIQDLGHTGRKYPLRVIFWGDDCDLQANLFEEMLSEKGAGSLRHPLYGVVNVVPFGKITRRDDLKTAANQVIFQVTFWETIQNVLPISQDDINSLIEASLDDYNVSASNEFGKDIDLSSSVEKSTFKVTYEGILDTTKNGLEDIANAQADVKKQFDSIYDSIKKGIDILVDDPVTLGFQTVQLIQSPGRATGSIIARLNAYGNLIDQIITGDNAIKTKGFDSQNSNDFHTADIFASTYIAGAIVAVLNHEYETKTNAIRDAERILYKFDELTAWRDANFKSLDQIDTGEAYQKLQQSVALMAGFITELSFSLAQEKSVILDRDRTIIDLCGELYGVVDDQLDFMINSNNMSGDDIIELRRGQEIVYFL
jgi:hypothetical protein